MLRGTFAELHAADCIQTGADVEANVKVAEERFGMMFHGLMAATAGNPCNGCPVFKGGTCKAHQRYFVPADHPLQDIMNESFREVSGMFGIPQSRQRQMEVAKIRYRQQELYHPGIAARRSQKEQETKRVRCPACGNKIRGENHAEHCRPRG